ncbi:MAG: hypothetical protein ACM33V_15330 [Chloroflexota bacterium]|nr:hypothetical protein [Anaerolineales bacterium]
MNEQEEFFEPKHKRLLSIATWAKYLAWVALVVYILNAGLQIIQYQNLFSHSPTPMSGWQFLLKNEPFQAFKSVTDVAATVLRGIIYYLVLKGISLGLNMIVETDINYRDREQEQVAQ